MNNIIEERLITLNTASAICLLRNGTFKSDVEFDFKSILKDDKSIERASISVLSAQIPVSYYNVNIYNNILNITNGVTPYSLTLTVGNYTSTTLQSMISNVFIANGLTTYSFSYSTVTGKLTISNTTVFTINYSGSTSLSILGYSQTVDTTAVLVNTVYVAIGEYQLNLLGTLRIRILSTQLHTYNFDSSISGGVSLLASIPVEAPPYGVILYDNITKSATELRSLDINAIDIQLVDDLGNLLQLNNIDWSITLALYIERKPVDKSKTDFKDIVKPIITELKNLENVLIGENQQEQQDNTDEPEDLGIIPEQEDTDDLFDMFYQNGITL